MKTQFPNLVFVKGPSIHRGIHDHESMPEGLIQIVRYEERDSHFSQRVQQAEHAFVRARSKDCGLQRESFGKFRGWIGRGVTKRVDGHIGGVKMGHLRLVASTGKRQSQQCEESWGKKVQISFRSHGKQSVAV